MRQPIPLLPTGKPLRGENSKHHCLFRVDCHRAELVNGLIEQI